jgi:hypothetical protein
MFLNQSNQSILNLSNSKNKKKLKSTYQLEMLNWHKEKKKIYPKIRKSLRSKYQAVMECGTARLKWNILQENSQGPKILNLKNK